MKKIMPAVAAFLVSSTILWAVAAHNSVSSDAIIDGDVTMQDINPNVFNDVSNGIAAHFPQLSGNGITVDYLQVSNAGRITPSVGGSHLVMSNLVGGMTIIIADDGFIYLNAGNGVLCSGNVEAQSFVGSGAALTGLGTLTINRTVVSNFIWSAIAAGSSATGLVTVAGAKQGDAVSLTCYTNNDMQIRFDGYVLTTNTVYVRASNVDLLAAHTPTGAIRAEVRSY